jgi:hypothetical protein
MGESLIENAERNIKMPSTPSIARGWESVRQFPVTLR